MLRLLHPYFHLDELPWLVVTRNEKTGQQWNSGLLPPLEPPFKLLAISCLEWGIPVIFSRCWRYILYLSTTNCSALILWVIQRVPKIKRIILFYCCLPFLHFFPPLYIQLDNNKHSDVQRGLLDSWRKIRQQYWYAYIHIYIYIKNASYDSLHHLAVFLGRIM